MASAALAPRQLDIIADTALAADPRLKVSAAEVQCFVNRSPPAPKYSASSTVVEFDRRRKAARLSHEAFCRAAGMTVRNWFRLLAGEQRPAPATIRKLEAAFAEPRTAKPPKVIAGFHRLVIGLCADAMGEPRQAVLAADMTRQRPQNSAWLRAAEIRMMATYITCVELEVENAELARALGQSRQAVQKARNRIEDLRDTAAIDAALASVTAQVRAEMG